MGVLRIVLCELVSIYVLELIASFSRRGKTEKWHILIISTNKQRNYQQLFRTFRSGKIIRMFSATMKTCPNDLSVPPHIPQGLGKDAGTEKNKRGTKKQGYLGTKK